MLSEQRYKEILNVLDREGSVKTVPSVHFWGLPGRPYAETWKIWKPGIC